MNGPLLDLSASPQVKIIFFRPPDMYVQYGDVYSNSAFLTTENGGAVKRIIASPLPAATVNAAPSPTVTLTSTPAESGINLGRDSIRGFHERDRI